MSTLYSPHFHLLFMGIARVEAQTFALSRDDYNRYIRELAVTASTTVYHPFQNKGAQTSCDHDQSGRLSILVFIDKKFAYWHLSTKNLNIINNLNSVWHGVTS